MNSIHKTRRFMKNRMIRNAIAFLILVSIAVNCLPIVYAASYTDVPSNHWAYDAVEYVTRNGYMNGVGNNLFNPDGVLSRAQIITVLYRVSGDTTPFYYQPYSDVASGTYYYNAVCWANSYSLSSVIHTSPTVFSPNSSVTRVKIAELIWKFAQIYGWASSAVPSVSLPYTDIGSLSTAQINALKWCYYNSIMIGVSSTTFAPFSTIKRAQLAKLIYNFDEYVATDRAFCVGTNYGSTGLDTTADVTLAKSLYENAGKTVTCVTVPTVTLMRNSHYIKSSFLFFRGEGYYNRIDFNYMQNGGDNKTGVYYGNDVNISGYNYVGIEGNMDFVKMAVFAGSNTTSQNDNIAKRAAENGADFSIGWTYNVWKGPFSNWLANFNSAIASGFSPDIAKSFADNFDYPSLCNVTIHASYHGSDYDRSISPSDLQDALEQLPGLNNILNDYYGDINMNGENDAEVVAEIIHELNENFKIDDYTVYIHDDDGVEIIVYRQKIGAFEMDTGYTATIDSGKLVFINDRTVEISEEERNRLCVLSDRLGISAQTEAERTISVHNADSGEGTNKPRELTEALQQALEQTQSSPEKEAVQQRYAYYYDVDKKTTSIVVCTDYKKSSGAEDVDVYYYSLT